MYMACYSDFKGTSLNSSVKADSIFPCLKFLYGSSSKIYRNGSYIRSLISLGFDWVGYFTADL